MGVVGLDLHAPAAAVALLAARQLGADLGLRKGHAGGHAVNDDGQPGAMRFAGGEPAEVGHFPLQTRWGKRTREQRVGCGAGSMPFGISVRPGSGPPGRWLGSCWFQSKCGRPVSRVGGRRLRDRVGLGELPGPTERLRAACSRMSSSACMRASQLVRLARFRGPGAWCWPRRRSVVGVSGGARRGGWRCGRRSGRSATPRPRPSSGCVSGRGGWSWSGLVGFVLLRL